MPENLRNDANLFGFEWYDNIWGMLMMNSVNGGGVPEPASDFGVPNLRRDPLSITATIRAVLFYLIVMDTATLLLLLSERLLQGRK